MWIYDFNSGPFDQERWASCLSGNSFQDFFRETLAQAPVGIAHVSTQGVLLQVNQHFCSIIGDSQVNLLNQSLIDLMVVNDPHHYQQQIQRLLQGDISFFRCEAHHDGLNDSKKWFNLSISLASYPCLEDNCLIVVLEDIGKHKLLEAKLRDSEQQMRAIFESIRDLVFICTIQHGEIKDINFAPTHLDYENFNLVVSETTQCLWCDNQGHWKERIQTAISTGKNVDFEYSLSVEDQVLWFSACISPMADQAVLVLARDISERKKVEIELFEEKELAQVTLHSIGDAVITTDIHGDITNLNPVAESMTGWKTHEVKGIEVSEIFNIVHERTRRTVVNPIYDAIRTGKIVTLDPHTLLISRDGTEYAIEDSAAPIRNRSGQVMGAIMVFHDATDSRKLRQKLSWQANHDSLTELINRRQFEKILLEALQSSYQDHHQHVLCFLDLDQFKIVNDTCGHEAGDGLLCQVAELLQDHVRATDTVARLGGDEFAILLHRCSLEQGMAIAENLSQIMHAFRFSWAHKVFSIGVSIGLVRLDQYSSAVNHVLSVADAACYAAKAKGRNRIQFYETNDTALLQQRCQQLWRVRIDQAIEANRFCLYGQTIEPTEKQTSHCFCEVLIRMIDEQGQVISAGEFIPAAERFNLITEIDRWVISRFLRDYRIQHQSDPYQSNHVTQYMINLSGASIGDEEFLQFLRRKLLKYPEAAQHICFEITETAAIANLDQALYFMAELKQLGCQFALDDFGSGMSSFGYLKVLPVDYLKIDGSFIQEMTGDTATSAIVEAINTVGHIMGMKTIAEFVKNSSVRQQLNDLGVDFVQGYGISNPRVLEQCFVSK